jgi:hypothetical protein
MNWLKDRLKSWLGIDKIKATLDDKIDSNYQSLKKMDDSLYSDLVCLEKQFNKHTRTDVDLGSGHGESYIIISGKWRNKDHVEVIRIDSDEFEQVMQYVKDIRRWDRDRNYRVDAPFTYLKLSFKPTSCYRNNNYEL